MISAVIVSYRSAALARHAIETLRREAESARLPLEVIAVVNSGDPAEGEALRAHADVVLEPARNLGFAGGLNAGARVARGETLLLANPDLVFLPGSVAALHDAVQSNGLLAAGPAFWWDEAATIFQPPADEPCPLDLCRRQLARRDRATADRLFRRELRRVTPAYRAAVAGENLRASALRGALVAVSRRTLDAVGPFDEEYALYYEENDWQHRLRRLGGALVYVGGAHVVHKYNQSARTEPRAAGWFAASERRYFTTHFGEAGVRAMADLAATPDRVGALAPLSGPFPAEGVCGPSAIAISPSPAFLPFLYQPLENTAEAWELPTEIVRGIAGSRWYVRHFDVASGRVYAEGALPSGAADTLGALTNPSPA
ncbi:MAG: glycosyltransferase family 2 protein [Thermoanaerobaculia bacterium]